VSLELLGGWLVQTPHGNGSHDEGDGRYGKGVKDKLQDGL
jgi:hypothetical protein